VIQGLSVVSALTDYEHPLLRMRLLPISESTSAASLADLFKMMGDWKQGRITESEWRNWANSFEVRWEFMEGFVR
jgi:type III restriction enzyme